MLVGGTCHASLAAGGCDDQGLVGSAGGATGQDAGSEHAPVDGVGGGRAGGDASGNDAGDDRAAAPYSIVVLPDTQFYSSSWRDIFISQTRWIVDNVDAQQIAFVLHTGDIVDSDVPDQWDAAARSLHLLDGHLPYVITAGNHDYFNLADRMGMINTYFPPTHFSAFSWFGETFEAGHVENSFSVLPVDRGRASWLVLALEFGPRDEVLAWAASVLDAYRLTPAIIVTHAYLYRDGTPYDQSVTPHQQFNPHDYVMMGQPGTTVNDGEEIWQKVISRHNNVKLVFSGHDVNGRGLGPGTVNLLTRSRADGTVVHQILANYQTCTAAPCESYAGAQVHGGNGFLRLLRFNPGDQTIAVTSYSPYLDESLADPANKFVLPMN
ncbi:MAG: metallophosphoesterase [Myxococcales bacterium]